MTYINVIVRPGIAIPGLFLFGGFFLVIFFLFGGGGGCGGGGFVLDFEFGELFEEVGSGASEGFVVVEFSRGDDVSAGAGGGDGGVPFVCDVDCGGLAAVEDGGELGGVLGGDVGQERGGVADLDFEEFGWRGGGWCFEVGGGLEFEDVVFDFGDFGGGDGFAVNVHLAKGELDVDDGECGKGQKEEDGDGAFVHEVYDRDRVIR